MTVISIAINSAGETDSIQDWLNSNTDKVISKILMSGSYIYIFYE